MIGPAGFMAGPKENRNRALALRCAKLAREGLTHRAIADAVGKRPEQIKALILLGERLDMNSHEGSK